MNYPPLAEFNLVGGTALALQKGHRVSVDLDLFGPELDKDAILNGLEEPYAVLVDANYFLSFEIRAVKVDILKYDAYFIPNNH